MSFTLSDVIIENSIRQGLAIIRTAAMDADALTNPTSRISQIIDVLFDFSATGQLVRTISPDGSILPNTEREGGIGSAVANKYLAEKTRLITFFRDNEIAIVHAFSDVQTRLPCVSIQLGADGEDQGLALTDDFGGISGLEVTTMQNALGRDVNTIHANAVVNVGIHTKEQLLTRYLYHVVKYTILSNKLQLIEQNFIIATFRGSDFTRDSSWQGDHVYTRFLNISGKTEDSWTDIDEIVVQGDQIDLTLIPSPLEDQMTGTFNNPSSRVNSTLGITSAEVQVANTFYLAPGPATLITTGPASAASITLNRQPQELSTAMGRILTPSANRTADTVLTITLTNGNGTTNTTLTIGPITNVGQWNALLTAAWNASTDPRLSEYTAIDNQNLNIVELVADTPGAAANASVFTVVSDFEPFIVPQATAPFGGLDDEEAITIVQPSGSTTLNSSGTLNTGTDFLIGIDILATAVNLAAAINRNTTLIEATVNNNVVTIETTAGNATQLTSISQLGTAFTISQPRFNENMEINREAVTVMSLDQTTNIATLSAPPTMTHSVIPVTDPNVTRSPRDNEPLATNTVLFMGSNQDIINISGTIQTRPSPITTSNDRQVNNPTGSGDTGVIHSTDVDGQQV